MKFNLEHFLYRFVKSLSNIQLEKTLHAIDLKSKKGIWHQDVEFIRREQTRRRRKRKI